MRGHAPLLTLALAVSHLCASPAAAQVRPSDAYIDSILQARVDEGRTVGIVVGILEPDGSTRIFARGEGGPETLPLDENTVFEIGSISKAFTGVLLAEMAGRGEVAPDDPVQAHLPEGVRMPSRGGREITLEDISTHHSGLPRLPGNLTPADASNPYADYSVEQMYAFLGGYELPRDVGAQYEYSNFATGLLGHVLAGVAGGSYEEVVKERILEPVGMTMSGITLTPEMERRMARGHDARGDVVPLWDIPTLAGAGALRSNLEDMLRFVDANLGEPEGPLEEAMRVSHQERRTLSSEMGIGLNWHVRHSGERRIVWHNGGTAGFRTFVGFDPAAEMGVVVLTNSGGEGSDDIGFHLLDPELPLAPPPTPAAERVEVEVDPGVLADYVGAYELTPEFVLTVTLEDGALFVQATNQPRFAIFPESETSFFLRAVEAAMVFERDESGTVTGLVLHQAGAAQRARKVRE